jgi:hypothetical protein
MPFGFFFGFDFLAEFFVFGVFGFAAFAFVVGFGVVSFFVPCLGFVVVRFSFVFNFDDDGRPLGGGRQADGVGRGGRCEQQQRGEQEDEQDREFPHRPSIGGRSSLP